MEIQNVSFANSQINNMKKKLKHLGKELASSAKLVGYQLPKAILRKSFTSANVTDVFPDMKKKKK